VDQRVRSKNELLQSDICLGAGDIEMLASLPATYFSEPANVVTFEPKLKEKAVNDNQGSVVTLKRPT
jgi:hypothetical protein